MKYILSLYCLTLSLSIFSQAFAFDELVVISSELNIREGPNLNSKVLLTLSNGDVVYPDTTRLVHGDSFSPSDLCDSINGLYGCWQRIHYQEHSGWVFSPYLGRKYMLYYEDLRMQYLPKMQYWYGVYVDKVSGLERIRLIKTHLEEKKYSEDEHKHKILKTNQPDTSIFIIATNEFIPEKEMGLFTKNNRVGFKCSEYLLPGDSDYVFFSSENNGITSPVYYLITTGCYVRYDFGVVLTDHDIIITDSSVPDPSIATIQNITQYFGWKEIYHLKYFGDIDGDGKPDIIIGGYSNSGGYDILFLSSLARKGELVRPASSVEFVDEC